MHEMIVRHLMTKKVTTLNATQSLPLVHELMKLDRIRHLPIVDRDNKLVGLITHRDLLARATEPPAET